jgi:hypothetical protein
MKHTQNIKTFFRSASIHTNPAQDQAILAEALRAGGLARSQARARAQPSIWRTIMKSRTTRLVTAAGIVAAVVISISHFKGAVVKAVEFEEITQAMQHVPWMHMTASGFQDGASGPGEQWIGFESRIHAGKDSDGTITFASEKDHKRFVYNPNTAMITVTYLEAFPLNVTSPATLLESMRKILEQEGAKTVARIGDYEGHKAQIQEISLSSVADGGGSQTLRLYLDPDSKRLYAAEVKGVDAAGNVVMAGNVTFDYPPSGPQSIYDLGVPREARLVDKTPTSDFNAVWEEYKRHKAEAANEYIAVIVHQDKVPSEMVRTLDVDYRSGRKERHERYFLSPRGEVIPELGPQYREELSRSLASLRAWARRRYEDPHTPLSIHLYDGQYYNTIDRDSQGGWEKLNRAYSPNDDETSLSQTVAFQAWPAIPSTARIIEDDYARQNGLLCVENLTQGQVLPGPAVGHPGRFLYYLDPARDYLCRRQVMEWRPNAEWQLDKTWLKNVDPKKVRGGGMVVWESTEVFQAPNGHWYPRVIVQKQTEAREDYRSAPLKVYDVETIYLDLSPSFPEGIFDPNNLPRR